MGDIALEKGRDTKCATPRFVRKKRKFLFINLYLQIVLREKFCMHMCEANSKSI